MPKATPGQDTGYDRAPTALEDPGTGQAFILLGWIPPAVAAVVGGVIVAFGTGDASALVGVALGGTVVGYVAGLLVLFTCGGLLEGVGERVANGFLMLVVAVSVVAALAVALAASGFDLDPALERTMTSVLGLIVIVVMVVSLIAMRGSRSSSIPRGDPGGRIVKRPTRISDASLRVLAGWADFFASDPTIGQWRGGEADADGVIQMPWFEYADEIQRFRGEMSEAGFVQPVPWMDWSRTPRGQRLVQDPAAIAEATCDDLVYLLTTIIRGERFSDGQIAGAYERGTLLALARRAGAILSEAG